MGETVKGELLYSSPDYQREMLERQMPRVLRGAVPELDMVSVDVVEAMVIQLIDGANRDQRSAMFHMVLERMHRNAVGDSEAAECSECGATFRDDFRPVCPSCGPLRPTTRYGAETYFENVGAPDEAEAETEIGRAWEMLRAARRRGDDAEAALASLRVLLDEPYGRWDPDALRRVVRWEVPVEPEASSG